MLIGSILYSRGIPYIAVVILNPYNKSMKILGLDYGEKNVGLALSDDLRVIAAPLPVLKVRSLADAVTKVHQIIRKHGVQTVVVGLALGAKREETQQSIQTRYFVDSLTRTNGVKIEFWNESFSTKQARDSSGSIRKKKNLDSEAARIILQEYLDYKREPEKVGAFITPQVNHALGV